jgi:superfamily I DNA/RNA helicase
MMRDGMKVSKGLEFPVVALAGVGHMLVKGEDEQEASRVFYVAATRAQQRLVIGMGGLGGGWENSPAKNLRQLELTPTQ